MSHAARLAQRHATELRAIDDALPEIFAEAAGVLEERLGEEELGQWARLGLGLARLGPRAPDLSLTFFEASRGVGYLGLAALARWAELAVALADRAPEAGVAFLEATPAALAHLDPGELAGWAHQGRRLCRGSWKSARLAARFFRASPDLLGRLSPRALDHLVTLLGRLAPRSDELASACLHDAPAVLARLAEDDREPFLAFVGALCRWSWSDAPRCFERGPALLEGVQPGARRGLLELAAAAAPAARSDGFSLFVTAAEALGHLDPPEQVEVLDFARRLLPHGARAAIESVVSAPEVRRRLGPGQARRWSEVGLALLGEGRSAERAESYFRLESALAEEMLGELAGRLEISHVVNLLRLYAEALSGESLLVQPTDLLVARNIGWAASAAPTTDGLTIFLPPAMDLFENREANFQAYKVYTTHQAGRIEFGSFRYRFGADGEHLASTVLEREQRRRQAGAGNGVKPGPVGGSASPLRIPMQRLFDLFDDRRLASALFALVEGARIDACVGREYPGIRRALRRLQELEAARRPDLRRMPLRQAFVENLVRASLGHPETIRWPRSLALRLERAVATLRVVERPSATVQDAAEVTAALYDLAVAIPNLPPARTAADWCALDEEAVSRASGLVGAEIPPDAELPAGEESPYQSPEAPGYRGAFKPELVQLIERLAGPQEPEEDAPPLTREQLLELLENSAEIELAGEGNEGDVDALLLNLEREVTGRAEDEDRDDAAGGGEDSDQGIEWFRYDEWDFRAHDYRPGWCRVGERTAAEGELDFYDQTLRRYHGLVVETRRQFERMRPESFRRIKRLEDGHEIDLDRAIEFHADKKAGTGPLARVYTRRNKVERDIAVAFLIDLSGSTSEAISTATALRGLPHGSGTEASPEDAGSGGKRIIDIERESTVLVVEALEAIGDAYALYGFSGHGRENVEFHVIKDLDEPFDDPVRRRIDQLEPIRSTRMGPAIRHAITKLNQHAAKVKILILVSDGRPQDEEYGPDRSDKEYAVHDTKRALLEAKRQGITPFLITVDSGGHDYLRHMCDDLGYEVVADIESLPRRLPKLYRQLATD